MLESGKGYYGTSIRGRELESDQGHDGSGADGALEAEPGWYGRKLHQRPLNPNLVDLELKVQLAIVECPVIRLRLPSYG